MDKHKKIQFPKFRNNLKDFLDLSHGINFISGQSEADVTELRLQLKQLQSTSEEKQSLIAYLIWAIGKSIELHPEMQSIKIKNKIILFENVDVAIMVEKEMENGDKIPFPYIIRGAQKKSYQEINSEINRIRKLSLAELKGEKKSAVLGWVPKRIRMKILRRALNNPQKRKDVLGTVGLTNLGSELAGRRFWANPVSPYTCTMAIGSIYKNNDSEMLCLTMQINHDLVDGAPAVRFSTSFIDFIEKPTIL